MKKYSVSWSEKHTLPGIEANSPEEAIEKVQNGEITEESENGDVIELVDGPEAVEEGI